MKHHLRNELIFSLLFMTVLLFSQPAAADELHRTILKVDNLTCTSCLVKIKDALSQNAGVAGMSGDVRQGVVVVDHEQTLASEEVAAMVNKTGYPATILGSGTIDRANTIQDSAPSSGSCGSGGSGGCGGRQAASSWAGQEGRGEVVTTVFQVGNLSCVSCLSKIEEELRKLEGTVGMSGDLRRGLVSVDHDTALDGDKIAAVITALGYPAQVISSDPAKAGAATLAQSTGGEAAGSKAGCSGSGSCCNASSSLQKLYNRIISGKK